MFKKPTSIVGHPVILLHREGFTEVFPIRDADEQAAAFNHHLLIPNDH